MSVKAFSLERFSYNQMLVVCSYGEMEVNFANRRRTKLILSGTRLPRE